MAVPIVQVGRLSAMDWRLSSLCAGLVMALAPAVGLGQAWPAKPVRWIVPFPPGGGVDVTPRTTGQRLAPALGQQLLVDNRGGASSSSGVELATKAPADGYTLLMATAGNIVISPHIYARL